MTGQNKWIEVIVINLVKLCIVPFIDLGIDLAFPFDMFISKVFCFEEQS